MVCIKIEEDDETCVHETLIDLTFYIKNNDIITIMSKNPLNNDNTDAMSLMEHLNFDNITFELTIHISYVCQGTRNRLSGESFSCNSNECKKVTNVKRCGINKDHLRLLFKKFQSRFNNWSQIHICA